MPDFITVLQVGAELSHAEGRTDRQTDMMKPIVAFRSFAKAHENGKFRGLLFTGM